MYIGRPEYIQQLNNMSFWYPILELLSDISRMPDLKIFRDESGKLSSTSKDKEFTLNIPETRLFQVPRSIGKIVDGEKVEAFERLVADVNEVRESFGGEAFLRTGHTSNKHDWSNTCHLMDGTNVARNLATLIDFSMMVDLPYTTFAVRKMIDTVPETVAFNGMPIAREVRLFAKEGKLLCAHPYWPTEAFENEESVTVKQLEKLHEMPDLNELTKVAEYVSGHFLNAWSIDFLQDKDGKWWLIDMALANTSYHWPGCETQTPTPPRQGVAK